MFILYILECMLMFVVGGYSPQEEILKSTGQPITENDILAGSLGWSILNTDFFDTRDIAPEQIFKKQMAVKEKTKGTD